MSKKNKYKQPSFVAPSEVSSIETHDEGVLSNETPMFETLNESIDESVIEETIIPEEIVIIPTPVPVFQAAPQPVDPQRLTIADAASRLIVNFKPHHLPGIQAFAKTQGYSEHASADEYADLFRRYGLKVKK